MTASFQRLQIHTKIKAQRWFSPSARNFTQIKILLPSFCVKTCETLAISARWNFWHKSCRIPKQRVTHGAVSVRREIFKTPLNQIKNGAHQWIPTRPAVIKAATSETSSALSALLYMFKGVYVCVCESPPARRRPGLPLHAALSRSRTLRQKH